MQVASYTPAVYASERRRRAAKSVHARKRDEHAEQQAKADAEFLSKDDKDFINQKMAQYDKDNSGHLDAGELAGLLRELNDGIPPGDEEVQAILANCDADGNAKISRGELMLVIAAWFARVEEKKEAQKKAEGGGGCCIVM